MNISIRFFTILTIIHVAIWCHGSEWQITIPTLDSMMLFESSSSNVLGEGSFEDPFLINTQFENIADTIVRHKCNSDTILRIKTDNTFWISNRLLRMVSFTTIAKDAKEAEKTFWFDTTKADIRGAEGKWLLFDDKRKVLAQGLIPWAAEELPSFSQDPINMLNDGVYFGQIDSGFGGETKFLGRIRSRMRSGLWCTRSGGIPMYSFYENGNDISVPWNVAYKGIVFATTEYGGGIYGKFIEKGNQPLLELFVVNLKPHSCQLRITSEFDNVYWHCVGIYPSELLDHTVHSSLKLTQTVDKSIFEKQSLVDLPKDSFVHITVLCRKGKTNMDFDMHADTAILHIAINDEISVPVQNYPELNPEISLPCIITP